MQIKSTMKFNVRLISRHVKPEKESLIALVGSTQPDYITIPAGATLDLPDEQWAPFASAAVGYIEHGNLVLTEAPKLTAEDQAAADEKLEDSLRLQMAELKDRQAAAEKD